MITVRELSAPTRCAWIPCVPQIAVYPTGYEEWSRRRAPSVLLAVDNEILLSETPYHVGSRPRRLGPSYGKLRDKGVFHLNAKGTIDVYSEARVYEFWDAGSGMVQPAYKRSNGIVSGAWLDAHWGSSKSMRMDFPSYISDYKRTLYEIGPSSWEIDLTFDGDVGFITIQVINPTRNKVGAPPTPGLPPSFGFMLLKRVGDSVYTKRFPSSSQSGYVTGADRLAASIEVLKPGLTGYTNSTADFVVFEDSGAKTRIIDEIVSSANYQLSRMDVVPDFQPDFGALALSCFDQLRLVDKSVFNLVFDALTFKDFLNWGKSLRADADFKRISSSFNRILRTKGPKKARAFLRELRKGSNAFLGTKYGVITNVSDVSSLIRGLCRFITTGSSSQRLHSRKEVLTSSALGRPISILNTLTVECDRYPTWFTGRIQGAIGKLKMLGLYPEIYDLWDIVPYSFVLDWFIPIGDFLEDESNYLNVRDYFPIRYCILSDRREAVWDVRELYSGDDFSSATISGNITLTWYYRWISRELPLPTVSLKAESTVGDHLLESTALIVQRTR